MDNSVGSISYVARIDSSKIASDAKEVEKSVSKVAEQSDDSAKRSEKSWSTFAKVGLGAVATTAVAVGAAIVSNIGGAIGRVDTLNNSAKVFKNLGFNADDVSVAMQGLQKSILGLPTSLDSAVRGTQNLAATYGSITLGQKVFSALNNAILSVGGSTDDVSNAIQQLSQLPLDGPLDAQTWNSLRNSGLTPVLVAMSKDMGKSISQMKEDFGSGTLTVQDFVNELQKLDTVGGGGVASLQTQVKDATSGIGTGFSNMNTAVTRGIADIIKTIGAANISGAISTIGSAFETALKGVAGMITYIRANKDIFLPIIAGIGGLVAALLVFKAVQVANELMTIAKVATLGAGALQQLTVSTKIGTLAQAAFNAVMSANPISLIILAVAGLIAGLIYFFTQTKLGKAIVQNVMKAIGVAFTAVALVVGKVAVSITSFFKDAFKNIKNVWDGIIGFFVAIGTGIAAVFNSVVSFFKQWGLTILAVIFFPFSIALGLIYLFKDQIKAVFSAMVNTIVAVVSPIVQLFVTIFNTIVAIFTPIVQWFFNVFQLAFRAISLGFGLIGQYFRDRWNEIMGIFEGVGRFFGFVFSVAFEAIKSVFSSIGSFFSGVWKTITALFGTIGTAIGNTFGAAFKNIINGVLKFATNMINNFIDTINIAIDIINNIPGVHIGKIGRLPIPQLAEGGIVSSPTLAMIGEGRESEAVIPLSKLDKMMNNDNGPKTEITIGNITIADKMTADYFLRKLSGDQEITSSGLVPLQKYMGAN